MSSGSGADAGSGHGQPAAQIIGRVVGPRSFYMLRYRSTRWIGGGGGGGVDVGVGGWQVIESRVSSGPDQDSKIACLARTERGAEPGAKLMGNITCKS